MNDDTSKIPGWNAPLEAGHEPAPLTYRGTNDPLDADTARFVEAIAHTEARCRRIIARDHSEAARGVAAGIGMSLGQALIDFLGGEQSARLGSE